MSDHEFVYKYPLDFLRLRVTVLELAIPQGAELLSLELQRGVPCIWARVDTSQPVVRRTFVLYGTGQVLRAGAGNELKHVGSFQLEDGNFVFHVFELVRRGGPALVPPGWSRGRSSA